MRMLQFVLRQLATYGQSSLTQQQQQQQQQMQVGMVCVEVIEPSKIRNWGIATAWQQQY